MGIQFGHVISKWRSVNFKPIKKNWRNDSQIKENFVSNNISRGCCEKYNKEDSKN